MDDFQKDLKEKWSKLSLFGGRKTKGFKGQGQKLGSADAPKVRSRATRHAQQQATMQAYIQLSICARQGYTRQGLLQSFDYPIRCHPRHHLRDPYCLPLCSAVGRGQRPGGAAGGVAVCSQAAGAIAAAPKAG